MPARGWAPRGTIQPTAGLVIADRLEASRDMRSAVSARSAMAGKIGSCWSLARETASQWSEHKAPTYGAALAYYSIFSLGPLLVIAIAIAGSAFGEDAARNGVTAQLRDLLGDAGAQAIAAMLAGAAEPRKGLIAGAIGLATLLLAATGVVRQLKDAMNTIWEVNGGAFGLWSFAKGYLLSIAIVASVGFLLSVSLLITTAVAALGARAAGVVPEAVLQAAILATSFAVTSAVFAMMFRWLPDAAVGWKDVWLGAVLTAILFEAGKLLIGLYIGKLGLDSTYGAAASLVVVLIWVYYNAQIVLLGAEFTHVVAKRRDAQSTEPEDVHAPPTSVATST
jgi:membrane protein